MKPYYLPIFTSLFLIYIGLKPSFAADNINIKAPTVIKKLYNFAGFRKNYQNSFNTYSNNIDINISIDKKNGYAFSNGDPYNCKINLVYNYQLKENILHNFQNDLTFTLLHEFSHCILNKETIYKDIVWISEYQNNGNKNKQYIHLEELKYQQNKNYYTPPLLIYHEIFADVMGYFLLNSDNKRIILEQLITQREKNYNKNKVHEAHISFNALKEIKNMDLQPTSEELYFTSLRLTQKYFLCYLEERKKIQQKIN